MHYMVAVDGPHNVQTLIVTDTKWEYEVSSSEEINNVNNRTILASGCTDAHACNIFRDTLQKFKKSSM